jgi:hypothetical protein
VQNGTKKVQVDLLQLRARFCFCGQFASISVQNRRLDGEAKACVCGAYAGIETAFSNLETLF